MRFADVKWGAAVLLLALAGAAPAQEKKPVKVVDIVPPPISSDSSVRIDYDIVYVRAPRYGDEKTTKWADFSDPVRMEPGSDLMLLRPDGSEEVLVSGRDGSVMDPYVSFDGEWVFYAKFIDEKHSGSDLFKIHVKTRKIVRLTDQTFTPNLGAADWAKDFRTPEKGKTALRFGVYNLSPCPVPGGKLAFTSNRNAYVPPRGYPKFTLQLFLMNDDGSNVEQTGYINIAGALHPVILKDGRIIFSTLESQGRHNGILWGIWSIHPDGTNWGPIVSAFAPGGAPSGFHFQAQVSDGTIVVEEYYNLNNFGFGTYYRLAPEVPAGKSAYGPGDLSDPRNDPGFEMHANGPFKHRRSFTAYGMDHLTRFTNGTDYPAPSSVRGENTERDEAARRRSVGKVTHPSGAPDNHLLTVWASGPVNKGFKPTLDSGLYLIKEGKPVDEPAQMRLIKNDPRYNEQWPRALVPYKRIYGVDEPKRLIHENDGKASVHLPEGTPFGLVGTSSMYKRESAPGGRVLPGTVTAVTVDPQALSMNWNLQGADAGIYDNSEIHAIRIVAQEPRTAIKGDKSGPLYGSHANERLRILGEIPVRKFEGGKQPVDPDGNPDTSFLAKLPANQSFTFQTIDKDGMVLNVAQTWHQLRPGERRVDCGGCHAHSQQPTLFENTAASKPDFKIFDLTVSTPLITAKVKDQSGRKWDKDDQTGLRYEKGIKNVEYYRDVKPILDRSCVPCHTAKSDRPAGGLALDEDGPHNINTFGDDAIPSVNVPATYFKLAGNNKDLPHGYPHRYGWNQPSRYVATFQSRRSLLVWKLFGRRLDGYTNDTKPTLDLKNPTQVTWKGQVLPLEKHRHGMDIDYEGSIMPPPDATKAPDGRAVKVEPLSDEDRRQIIRWIDLGCPIDLDPNYDAKNPESRSFGWMGDDQRPTLTMTVGPRRILLGMADAYTGLDFKSLQVAATVDVDGAAAGTNLASKFSEVNLGVWELKLQRSLDSGKIVVTVKDRQGNESRIERHISSANAKK
jgi:hypothetical protein